MLHQALLLALALLACLPTRLAAAQAEPSEPAAYWIFFEARTTAAADPDASPRALERRALRGAPGSERLTRPLDPVHLAALADLGVEPRVRSRWLNAVSAELTDAERTRVLALPFVRSVRPVGRTAVPAPQPAEVSDALWPVASKATAINYGSSQTQLAFMNAVEPLERGIDGRGVWIGFLDTEFGDFMHPVFDHLRAEGRIVGMQNFTGQAQTNRHGMSVASVAVGFAEGSLVGPAHGASVLAATTEYAPSETNAEEDYFVAGMEWMEAMGADVVNVSLGYSTFDPDQHSYTPADLDGDTGITTIAADRAAALGVVVVTSAGNEGCSSPQACWYYITTPADGDSVITVGAARSDSSRASFSSFGPTADGRIKPDVSALGQSAYVAAGSSGYAFSSGTSFSSPLVAGVVAQILQVNPDLNPMEVRDLLRSTASDADRPGNSLGWGIVDAAAAVREAERLALMNELPPGAVLGSLRLFPNPATGPATIAVASGEAAAVRLLVYDVLGREVAVPFDGTLSPGLNEFEFDASALAPGVYFLRLEGSRHAATGRFVKVP